MKRLVQWLRGRRAVRLASIAFRQKYPDRRPATGTLYGADQSGHLVLILYGWPLPPPGRSWWHVDQGSRQAKETHPPIAAGDPDGGLAPGGPPN